MHKTQPLAILTLNKFLKNPQKNSILKATYNLPCPGNTAGTIWWCRSWHRFHFFPETNKQIVVLAYISLLSWNKNNLLGFILKLTHQTHLYMLWTQTVIHRNFSTHKTNHFPRTYCTDIKTSIAFSWHHWPTNLLFFFPFGVYPLLITQGLLLCREMKVISPNEKHTLVTSKRLKSTFCLSALTVTSVWCCSPHSQDRSLHRGSSSSVTAPWDCHSQLPTKGCKLSLTKWRRILGRYFFRMLSWCSWNLISLGNPGIKNPENAWENIIHRRL